MSKMINVQQHYISLVIVQYLTLGDWFNAYSLNFSLINCTSTFQENPEYVMRINVH